MAVSALPGRGDSLLMKKKLLHPTSLYPTDETLTTPFASDGLTLHRAILSLGQGLALKPSGRCIVIRTTQSTR